MSHGFSVMKNVWIRLYFFKKIYMMIHNFFISIKIDTSNLTVDINSIYKVYIHKVYI